MVYNYNYGIKFLKQRFIDTQFNTLQSSKSLSVIEEISGLSVCTKSINLRVNILCLKPQHIIHHWKGLIE